MWDAVHCVLEIMATLFDKHTFSFEIKIFPFFFLQNSTHILGELMLGESPRTLVLVAL